MYDIPWEDLLSIRWESVLMLMVFVVVIVAQEWLVQQKKYPTVAAVVQVILPLHMVVMFFVLLNSNFPRCSTDILWWVYSYACLPLGLVYALRCVGMDSPTFQRVGRVFSFIFAGWILVLLVTRLEVWMSDVYAGFDIPWYVYVAIYAGAAVVLVLILKKLNLPALRRQRFKDFQCIHCGYSLEGSMLATSCRECGGEIEPQISLPASGAAAAHEKPVV